MTLFWKKHTEPVPVVQVPVETKSRAADDDVQAATTVKDSQQQASNAGREAARRMAEVTRMTAEEIAVAQEQRRLALVRLDAIQRQIDEAAELIRQHRIYIDRKARHDEVAADMYAKNKAMAAVGDEEKRLARFEACEEALPLYLSLQVKEQWHQRARELSSQLKEKERTSRAETDRLATAAETAHNAVGDAETSLRSREETLATGYRTDGLRQAVANEQAHIATLTAACGDIRSRYAARRSELTQRLASTEAELADDQARFAPLDASRVALQSIDVIFAHLDQLWQLGNMREAATKRAAQVAGRQSDQNERLGRLFERQQTLEQQLMTLHGEVDMHRGINLGIDGQALQTHVMELRSRKQDLMMAAARWSLIVELHSQAEEKRNRIRSLQQVVERQNGEAATLELHVGTLAAEAAQRRYDYTLSKGQNVIKLRSDLREGVACTVCGATTHPFHSDTLLDQNKLIGEWKIEAERLDNELQQTREHLLTKQIEIATNQGTLATLSDELARTQAMLDSATAQWADCERIDPSLRGCQPSSMADARTQGIRGLIENCTRDENDAIDRLRTYNYHQQAINTAQENIDNTENTLTDLHTGLNETNTGCQVLASQSEWIKSQIESLTAQYHALYETIDKIIDAPDWYRKWQQSPDNFKAMMRERVGEWKSLQQRIDERQRKINALKSDIGFCDSLLTDIDALASNIAHRTESLAAREREAASLYARLFGDKTALQTYKEAREDLERRVKAWTDAEAALRTAKDTGQHLSGQAAMAGSQDALLTEAVGEARAALDDWMFRFRMAGNPPCRIDELHQLFGGGDDWRKVRETVRRARQDYDLACLHESELQSSLLALEQGDDAQSAARRETLLRQRRETLLTIARIEQRLAAHEQWTANSPG